MEHRLQAGVLLPAEAGAPFRSDAATAATLRRRGPAVCTRDHLQVTSSRLLKKGARRAGGACGARSRREEEAMRWHRRRRATLQIAPQPPPARRVTGGDGPSASLSLLSDATASPPPRA